MKTRNMQTRYLWKLFLIIFPVNGSGKYSRGHLVGKQNKRQAGVLCSRGVGG